VSTITTSLNQLLAANSAFGARPAVANPNSPANNFGRELLGDLKPGTTVTKQTQYTVDTNGRLQRTGSQIRIGEQQNDNASSSNLPFVVPAPPATLAELQKPKPQLSPTDEALLFDADSIEGGINGQSRRFFDQDGAQDENGQAVEVEVLSPDVADRELPALASQQQARVSSLYARNNDIIYNVEPQIAFAA
jgi:hypothetical protein